MSTFRSLVAGCIAFSLCAVVADAYAANRGFTPQNSEFDASKFTCLSYSSGASPNSNARAAAMMARIWIVGFLEGSYKATGTLEHSDASADAQALDDGIAVECQANPGLSIYTVALQALATKPYKVPTTISGDLSVTYTCSQHTEAKNRAAMKADLAELWAFGIVEGIKSVANPDLSIPIESKGAIIGALNRTCSNANNAEKAYRDLAAAVAEKVKMN
jgi:hypothetical protein